MTASGGRPTRGELLATVGVVVGMAVLVFGTGSWIGTYYSAFRVTSIVVGGAGALIWLVLALRRPELRPASALTGAFAAALAALGISALFAEHQRLAFDFLAYALLLVPLYFLLVRIMATPALAIRVHALLVVLCAATGVLFLVVVVQTWTDLWSSLGKVVVPPLRLTYAGLWLGTPNAIAAFEVLLLCAIAPRELERGRAGRIVVGSLVSLVAIAVILSASRGAWLGFGAAVAVTGIVWLVAAGGVNRLRRLFARVDRRTVTIVAAASLVVLVVAGVVAGRGILSRATNLDDSGLRSALLAASARMFQAAPLTGLGPGSWAPGRLAFETPSEIDYYIPHAHNLPAETAAELGVAGIVAGVVVIALLVRLVARGIRSGDRLTQRMALAALFAGVYITGQQLVDAWIHQPGIIFAFALPIAILDARTSAASSAPVSRPPAVPSPALTVAMIAAVVAGTLASLSPEPAAQRYEQASAAVDAGDWTRAYALARETVELDPHLPPNDFLLGLGAAATGRLEEARTAFAAAAIDDYPAAWLNLAAVQMRLGDPDAGASLQRAIRMGRQQPMIDVPAADLYRQLGDDATARSLLASAFATLPSLASDPTWMNPAWSEIASGAVDDAIATTDPWTAFLLALEAGRLDQARAMVANGTVDDGGLAESVVAAWGGDQAAFADLYAGARADPQDARLVGLCRRLARVHDPSGAAPGWSCEGRWWFGLYPLGQIGPSAERGPVPGPDAHPHDLYAYRRPGPNTILVPWLLNVYATAA